MLSAGLLTGLLCASLPAAAEADGATRSAARQLGNSGVEAYQAGDFPTASAKLERAYAALKVPSLGLWSARALVKLNRWVDASERLLEVTRLELTNGDTTVQKKAQADAQTEWNALTPRIPSAVVELKGAKLEEARVKVDGKALPPALVGASFPVDPGTHAFVVEVDDRHAEQSVAFEEGATHHVALELPAAGPLAASAPPKAVPAFAPSQGGADTDAAPQQTSSQRTLGLVAGGAGVVVVGVGALFFVKAKSNNADAKLICPSSVDCSEADVTRHSLLVANVKTDRTLSYVSFGVGGAALLGGALLFLSAPQTPSAAGNSAARRISFGAGPLASGGLAGLVQGDF